MDADLVHAALHTEGYAPVIRRVESREAYVAALADPSYDLIISDYSLPGFDGLTALGMARERRPETPFLLVTGTIGEEKAVEALQKGATDFILKHRLERLGGAVRRAVQEVSERTQRRHAEELLRVQGDLLRKVVDSAPNLIYVRNAREQFTLVNRAFADFCGRQIGEVIGSGMPQLGWSAGDVQRAAETDREVMATLRPIILAEYSLAHPHTGQQRWFLLTKVPLAGSDGRADHVLAVATDITDRRQLEAQLRQAQKLEAIGQVTGGVVHDFNNLLTAVLGTTEVLLLDLPDHDERRGDVIQIREAAQRGAALTRQLLAFSRKQVLQPRLMNLNELLRELEPLLVRLVPKTTIALALAAQLPSVKADPTQIEQVVVNLVVNARDAMPEKGEVVVRTQVVNVIDPLPTRTGDLKPGDYVMLSVADAGSGMEEATMVRVFEPFFTTKPEGKGTGLGLSTVYGIVQQSGGQIGITSTVGQGTTFEIFIPVAVERTYSYDESQRAG